MRVWQQLTTGKVHRREMCGISARTRYYHAPREVASLEGFDLCTKCWSGHAAPATTTTTPKEATTMEAATTKTETPEAVEPKAAAKVRNPRKRKAENETSRKAQAAAAKAKPKAEPRKVTTPDEPGELFNGLVADLKAAGVKTLNVRWSPKGNYASLLVQGKNAAYAWRQSPKGVRVMVALSMADVPKTHRAGFEVLEGRGKFAVSAWITDAKSSTRVAEVIAIAASNRAAQVAS